MKPDYFRIYTDIINKKFPQKYFDCENILSKPNLSAVDIIEINNRIFGYEENTKNQDHRSYLKSDIINILDYKKRHNMNNSELARHFKLNRNTIAKWAKLFVIE